MILSILNQKGGTTKTTSAVTLAVGAAMAGLKTCLIDLDTQANCADALGVPSAPDLYHMLIEGRDIEDVAMQPRPVDLPNFYLVRSDRNSAMVRTILTAQDFKEFCLVNALENYRYDLIVMDNAPAVDVLQTAALVASDLLLIPTVLAQFSIKGVVEAQMTLRNVHRMTPSKCNLIGILPTSYDRREPEQLAQLVNLVESFGPLVWPVVPVDARCKTANRVGKTIYEYAPKSRALVGYKESRQMIGGYNVALKKLLEYME